MKKTAMQRAAEIMAENGIFVKEAGVMDTLDEWKDKMQETGPGAQAAILGGLGGLLGAGTGGKAGGGKGALLGLLAGGALGAGAGALSGQLNKQRLGRGRLAAKVLAGRGDAGDKERLAEQMLRGKLLKTEGRRNRYRQMIESALSGDSNAARRLAEQSNKWPYGGGAQ